MKEALCATLSRPSENRISMVSFRMGSRPPWWMPMPLLSSGSTCSTWGTQSGASFQNKLPGFVYMRAAISAGGETVRTLIVEKCDAGCLAWNWAVVVAVCPLTPVTSAQLLLNNEETASQGQVFTSNYGLPLFFFSAGSQPGV